MTLKELIIDIREEHELLETHLCSHKYEIVNIPFRNLFANVEWVRDQTEKRPVWLMCRSGSRASAAKTQYFAKNDGIQVSTGGLTFEGEGPKVVEADVVVLYGPGGLGMQQYLQMAFGCILVSIGMIVYFGINRNVCLAIIATFAVFVIGQTMTKSCLLGKLVPRANALSCAS